MAGLTPSAAAVVREMVQRVSTRAKMVVRRAVVRSINAGEAVQTAKVQPQGDEAHEAVEVFEPHGFTSNPPDGSDAILLHPGGDPAHAIVLNAGSRSLRLKGLATGEVALYVGGETGAKLVLRANGDIEVTPGTGGKVKLGSPASAATQAVARAGDPVELTAVDIAWMQAVDALLFGEPGDPTVGAPVAKAVTVPGVGPPTGEGSITQGGQGATST